jgi:hypothetical protein
MKPKTQYDRICTALRIKAMTTMEGAHAVI